MNGPYKITLLGDTGVGKSSLVTRAVRNEFFEHQESTIGAAFLTKEIIVNDNHVKIEIWDTAGQERFRSLTPMYYRNAAAVIVCYDITCTETFEKAKMWVNEVSRKGTDNPLIILVGTKLDLEKKRSVNNNQIDDQYWGSQITLFHEVSSKTGSGVEELFINLSKLLLQKKRTAVRKDIQLTEIDHTKKKHSRCC